jgi:hypothetical protein
MRAVPAVAEAVRTQRKISAARSSSARNRTVGRKTPRLSEPAAPMRRLPPRAWLARARKRVGEADKMPDFLPKRSSRMRTRPIDGHWRPAHCLWWRSRASFDRTSGAPPPQSIKFTTRTGTAGQQITAILPEREPHERQSIPGRIRRPAVIGQCRQRCRREYG